MQNRHGEVDARLGPVRPLRENASKADCKRVQERVSGWLGNYDFVEDRGVSDTSRQFGRARQLTRGGRGWYNFSALR